MADDKTTKTPEQPVTDSGPGKETPPAPPKEPEKVSVSPEPEKKTEPEVKNPQVSVYNFAEIMKEKKVEERAAAPSGEKPAPAKTEKPEKQPEAPKKAEEKPKEPEQPKRRGRPPKADKDKAATPKPEAPAQKPENAVKKEPEKKTAPTVQAAPAPKEPEKPKDAPRRGKEQIVYIKLNELHAFKNHPFEVRDDEEMRAMVSSVKDKGVTQPAIVRPREDGGYEIAYPLASELVPEVNYQGKKILIVQQQVITNAVRKEIEKRTGEKEAITTATWFMRKEEILTDLNVDAADDISLKEEDDFISLVEKEGYDVIFADPCMERMIPGFEGVFIPLTHFAVSGKLNV